MFSLAVILAVLFGSAFLAGILGSYLGIGGGILLVPVMTLGLGIDIRVAVATSIVGVIATSTGAASVYVRDHLTHLRLGMFLEVATTIGAIAGAFLAILLPNRAVLFVLFGLVMLYATSYMARPVSSRRESDSAPRSRLAERLKLGDRYREPSDGRVHEYAVARPGWGFGLGALAGAVSGLLGVGGGFIQVPLMNVVMRVPTKPAVATSNFMIGVTAAASAFIYYSGGFLDPSLAGVLVVGVFLGTRLGTRFMVRARPGRIRIAFAILLAAIGVLMVLKAFIPGMAL